MKKSNTPLNIHDYLTESDVIIDHFRVADGQISKGWQCGRFAAIVPPP